MSDRNLRVVVAGGGTGGHLFPGLALADELARRGWSVAWMGTAIGLEARIVPTTAYPFHVVPGRQARGGGARRAVLAGVALAQGIVRGVRLLASLRPRLVVGVGGYASVAAVVAARLVRLPTLLLEQNAVPGIANRTLGRVARRVCLGFAEAAPYFPAGRSLHTGNPVRRQVLDAVAARQASERPRLLVIGGSQGARRVNEIVAEALGLLGAAAILDVRHQTGVSDRDRIAARYAELGLRVRVDAFIDDMGAAYAAADLAVSRAGAMSLAELTAAGVPAILVPFPFAADDHQRHNAEAVVRAGAARMLLEAELTPTRMAEALGDLVRDAGARANMADAARRYGRPDAAERVADVCATLVRG